MGKGEPLGFRGRRMSSLRSQLGFAEHQKEPTVNIKFLTSISRPSR